MTNYSLFVRLIKVLDKCRHPFVIEENTKKTNCILSVQTDYCYSLMFCEKNFNKSRKNYVQILKQKSPILTFRKIFVEIDEYKVLKTSLFSDPTFALNYSDPLKNIIKDPELGLVLNNFILEAI